MKRLLFLWMLLMVTACVHAQDPDGLAERMSVYATRQNTGNLFVHTDKHIYTNKEYIWFKAYLLDELGPGRNHDGFLNVLLVQEGSRAVLLQQKFLLEKGHSAGALLLPDSVLPGEYKLVAYTHLLRKDGLPAGWFEQPLTIHAVHGAPAFNTSFNVIKDSAGNREAFFTVNDKKSGAPVKSVQVMVRAGSQPPVTGQTDKKGWFTARLANISDTSQVVIQARLRHEGATVFLQKTLPEIEPPLQLQVKFYPESGSLVAGVRCRVGWEATAQNGSPCAIRGVLYRNGHAIDTLSSGEYGLGKFDLWPKVGEIYTFRPVSLPPAFAMPQEAYALPPVTERGAVVMTNHAIADDSLRIRICASGYSRLKMLVHNFRNTFVAQEVVTNPEGRNVLFVLKDLPRGLLAVTLLDSLNRPLAERLFFSRYKAGIPVRIQVDSLAGKRQQVTVNFHLPVQDSTAVQGMASVACVQARRLDARKQQDIETFYFLQAELEDLPRYRKGRGLDDRAYLEQALLVRGWRCYNWAKLADMHQWQDTARLVPVLSGNLQNLYRKKVKPDKVTLLGPGQVYELPTDSAGRFSVSYKQVVVPQEQKLWFLTTHPLADGYYIAMSDPYEAVNRKVAQLLTFPGARDDRYANTPELRGLAAANVLDEVVVTSNPRNDFAAGGANLCGDYVCPFNILNCPNHPFNPGNRLPVKGQTYNTPNGRTMYAGCTLEEDRAGKDLMVAYDGILIGKAFYGEDFSKLPAGGATEAIATLYWSPALLFDKAGNATCSFYTSDLTGRFRIVVNGITNNSVFYGTAVFNVQ
jgi:hypothetical protein